MAVHLMIYGPPAAGKLTVARALEERAGLRVLDNHATVDLVLRLFDFGTRPFGELVNGIRVDIARVAAREGVDVVSTFVYGRGHDEPFVARLKEAVESGGGRMVFVALLPPVDVLEVRVQEPSRGEHQKIRDAAKLRALVAAHDLYSRIRDDDLVIDNSTLSPDEVAAQICAHFSL